MVTSFLNRFAPIKFDGYIDRLTNRFTGREWLFEQHIDSWLQQQGKEQFYLLTGEPGVGKSAIVAQLVKRWKVQSEDAEQGILAAYHFCRAGDVETVRPGRVLRSIAAQLGKTLPYYGKALNKVLEQVHLNIDVNININSLTNGQVTGIYIENLKDLDPREELRLLIQAPLTVLPAIYKEEGTELPQLKVFLIDSLDEAVTTTGRDNVATLMAALSQTNDLPPWIRFILTARPNSSILQDFQSIQNYKLEELLKENLDDIQQYAGDRIQELITPPESEFQTRLEQAELSAETLVDEVKTLSEGNFLYTRLVMDGISTGELSLKNLSALPKNLNEVYQRFLRHRCPVRKWVHLYQPILGTLTVTQEAVSTVQLTKFARIASKQIEGEAQVEGAIGILRQFLDEVEDEQGQKLYTIFHQSLREYLLDRKRNHDFWCDAKEQHDNIIDYYKEKTQVWQQLSQINQYGVRNLTRHLVIAERAKELHTLLAIETSDGQIIWSVIKDKTGDTTGFLADIALAWEQAEQEFETSRQGLALGLQFRYSLITASFNSSSSKFPISILIALMKRKFWSVDEGVTYIEKIANPYTQVEAIIKLAAYLPNFLNEKLSELLKERISQIASLGGNQKFEKPSQGLSISYSRKTNSLELLEYFANLSSYIPHLPESLQQLINKNFSSYFQANLYRNPKKMSALEYLIDLDSYMNYRVKMTHLFELKRELELIKDEFFKYFEEAESKARFLLDKPTEVYKRYFSMDYYDEEDWYYDVVDYADEGKKKLSKLHKLKNGFLSTISLCSKVPSNLIHSSIKDTFISQLPPVESIALAKAIIKAVGSDEEKLAGLIYRSSEAILGSTVYEVLNVIRKINDIDLQQEVLIELLPYTKKKVWEQILIENFKENLSIRRLKPYLTRFKCKGFWREVLNECGERLRNLSPSNSEDLSKLVSLLEEAFPHLPNSLKLRAFQLISDIELPIEKQIRVLERLSLYSSNQLRNECLSKIDCLINQQKEQELKAQLRDLDSSLLELLEKHEPQQLLDNVKSIGCSFNESLLIAKLLPYLPQTFQETIIKEIFEAIGVSTETEVASALTLEREGIWGRIDISLERIGFSNLFKKLHHSLLPDQLSNSQEPEEYQSFTISSIEDEYERWLILREVLLTFPELVDENILAKFLSYEKANAKSYPRDERRFHRVVDLVEVGRFLPKSSQKKVFEKALKIILKPTSSSKQKSALLKLIPYLPNSIKRKAINVAFAIRSEESLNALIHSSSKSRIKETLMSIFLIEDDLERMYRLNLLIPYLPNSLRKEAASQAEDFAQLLDSNQSYEILIKLLPCLSESLINRIAKQVIDSIGKSDSTKSKMDLLINSLTNLAPYLSKESISKILQTASSILDKREKRGLRVLAALAPYATDPLSNLYPLWNKYLRALSKQDRQHWLSVIRFLVPFIEPLGGKEAVEEVTYVVQHIGRWYP